MSNGIYRDVRNNDYINEFKEKYEEGDQPFNALEELKKIPQTGVNNYVFKNNGDLTFTKKMKDWGFDFPINSNGAAYADLDNDGDLDLVLNNCNEEAIIMENESSNTKMLTVAVEESEQNRFGIGAKIHVVTERGEQIQEVYSTRGFQSSVPPMCYFGIPENDSILQVNVIWNDQTISDFTNIPTNTKIILSKGQNTIAKVEKTIASWNALMVSGLIDAYQAFGETRFLEMAEANMKELLKLNDSDSGINEINHLIRGAENAFLDDYAFTIKALIDLYQATFNEIYLKLANDYSFEAIKRFKDENSPYFYYSMIDDRVALRSIELQDLSIPSSNAVMAENLFLLGKYFDNETFVEVSKDMCYNMKSSVLNYGTSFSYWGRVMQFFTNPFYEVAITGDDSETIHKEWMRLFIPNALILGGESSLPLLKEKMNISVPTIFVCKEKVCQKPVTIISEALELMPH